MDPQTVTWRVIAIACSFLLLIIMTCVPMVSATAQAKTSIHLDRAVKLSAQETPTVDPTVSALEKVKLENENNWIWSNGATLLSTLFSTLAIVLAALFGLYRWLGDQRLEREKRKEDQIIEQKKRDEERFQTVIAGLGSNGTEAKVGSAIMLRTFLRPGYEQFYSQAFDLAVAGLRLRRIDPNIPEPLDSLSQALMTVFKESFHLARDELNKRMSQFSSEHLDAMHIQLDKTYLSGADLVTIWMPEAYLRGSDLKEAQFTKANLSEANLSGANLSDTKLMEANLLKANFSWANLTNADLTGTNLSGGNFLGANLTGANLTGANLTGASIETANSLKETKINGVTGLTKDQLDACRANGAIT